MAESPTAPLNPSSEGPAKTESPAQRRSRLMRQGGKVFMASLGCWVMGSMFTFPSVVATDLLHSNTTIYGTPISFGDSLDMMGSLVQLGSLPGAWAVAGLAVVLGRRHSMMISGALALVAWLGVGLAPSGVGVLVSRAVSGMAMGGLTVVVNIYAIELADPDVRGMMGMMLNLGIMAGQLVTVVVGYDTRYFVVALVNALIPTIFILGLIWLPESPSFLVLKGRDEEARKVIRELRGEHINVNEEIQNYRAMNEGREGRSVWRGLLQPRVLKSLAIVSMLFVIVFFSGFFIVNANASRMFKAAGSTIDANLAAIIINIVQLIGGSVGFVLADKLGRKGLLYSGLTLMFVSLTGLATYVGLTETQNGDGLAEEQIDDLIASTVSTPDFANFTKGQMDDLMESPVIQKHGWIPLACLIVCQFGAAFGVNAIPFILSTEYFPTWIRAQASGICFSVYTAASFSALQLYTPMREGLTQAGLYGFYACVSLVGIPFTYFFITETSGQQVG
ncbi:facilitated trehalose transporter Tret1-like [Penaeus japonicus]|uniref:facilitated trehalose transporter Tret1-like n=1 Tax=Penaeus japonicus TaxID=27405 RepID=UPI001C713EA4|nr:facilitated trehalose transporter Tret1-like [Penaeus japonicus]